MSVYFAQAGAYIKIGYSSNPISRVATVTLSGRRPKTLPRGAEANLIGWVPGGRELEAEMHRRFAGDHVAGEWFYLDPEVAREVIWADPRGVDIRRMSALAVFTAMANPDLTRDDMARAGVPIDPKPLLPFWNFGEAS